MKINTNFNDIGKKILTIFYEEDNFGNKTPEFQIFNKIQKANHKENLSTVFNSKEKEFDTSSTEVPDIPNVKYDSETGVLDIIDQNTYGKVLEKMTSGLYLDNLVVLNALSYERNLLSKLGLEINPTNKVLIIKDRDGEIKAAMSIKQKYNDRNITIKYIDVDRRASNLKRVLEKMNDNSDFIRFYENVELTRIPIDARYIKD